MDAAQLLKNSLSPDLAVRTDAEQKLEAAAKENLGLYCNLLANELVNDASPADARMAAGIALKNALSSKDPARLEEKALRWREIPDANRAEIKQKVLATLATQEHRAGSQAAQVVAAIAVIELPIGFWPDLIQQLLAAVSNQDNVRLRQAAVQAIGYTCENVKHEVLEASSNEILTAVIQGARKEETSTEVQLAALQALYNSLEFISTNFATEGERNFIMQTVCEATQSQDVGVRVAAYECLVRIMSLYYSAMRFYMEQALFGLTKLGMSDSEPSVQLQAIEFWSTVCDEEIEIRLENEEAARAEEAPTTLSFGFAAIALADILPDLMNLLLTQDEDADEDEWDVSKAAATCIGRLAACVGDAIVMPAIPFIEKHFKSEDWRGREAACMCFGSIMDGPQIETLSPLVSQALPVVISLLQDPNVLVKDTAAWTLGRITDAVCSVITQEQLTPLIEAAVNGLKDEPRIVTNCCWTIMNLCSQLGLHEQPYEEDNPPQTNTISPIYEGIVKSLLIATDRSDNASNSRTTAYEALASAMTSAPNDCLQHVSNVLLEIIRRQEHLNGLVNQLIGIDDRNNWAELQTNLCSIEIAIVRRLGKEIAVVSDKIMTNLLTLVQQCGKESTVLEDAFLAVGAVINALDADFERFLPAFMPFIVSGLKNHEEYQLCAISVGLVGDICRALGERAAQYCESFMAALFENLQSPSLHRDVKPPVLSCFGDVAMAIGAQYEKYLQVSQAMLQQAGMIQSAPTDYEMLDYVIALREGVCEAYTGIVSGLRGSGRVDLLQPLVENMVNFIAIVAQSNAEYSEETLTRGVVGLLGDLAAAFPNGELKPLLGQPWILSLIKSARSRQNGAETRRVAAWAREQIKRATSDKDGLGPAAGIGEMRDGLQAGAA
ncbi:karyopherin Kap95 [Tilletia horrida]|uniref:Importin-95 n=1 Tax=Tilletia horrida TaxID=155126 RepID=A0AAN6JPT0_9BASI|nr:karyopherin Kap95 [Tilletia horrida]KAK0539546.1 karyopherin Kap95 [Tilletia horrida]KAK0540945.1 karyopherin Kap95 [Tilletia horrida]KAK0566365.1 karyopherin Kap95 [Tilletia horrida]